MFGPYGKKPAILPYWAKTAGEGPDADESRTNRGLGDTDADGASQAGASELARDAMSWTVSPLAGKTTDWRAVSALLCRRPVDCCGKRVAGPYGDQA